MRKMDHEGLVLCRMQARLFEESAEKAGCSSAMFIRRFMGSKAAQRMDGPGFLAESSSIDSLLAEIDEEYGPSNYGSARFSPDELHWMGYLYRYWSYAFQWSSRRVLKACGARELRSLFLPYHSLDPEQAIRRICEDKGIPLDEDEDAAIARGVEVLRRIRSQSAIEYYYLEAR